MRLNAFELEVKQEEAVKKPCKQEEEVMKQEVLFVFCLIVCLTVGFFVYFSGKQRLQTRSLIANIPFKDSLKNVVMNLMMFSD